METRRSRSPSLSRSSTARSARSRAALAETTLSRPLPVMVATTHRRSDAIGTRRTKPSLSSRSTSWVTLDFTQLSRSASCPERKALGLGGELLEGAELGEREAPRLQALL